MGRPQRDPIDDWFSILEARGECMRFRLGRYVGGMTEPEWFFLPHQTYDGLGGLAHVLRSVYGTAIDLPHSTQRAPSWLSRLHAVLYCLFRRHPRPLAWAKQDTGWRARDGEPCAPNALSWALLSHRDTERLRELARRRSVSLNAWLLWGLTRSIWPQLARSEGSLAWIVPINMRGLVPGERDTANLASTLDVAFQRSASVNEIHAQIQRQIDKAAHWGTWQLLQWLRLLSPAALERIASREMLIRKHGSFSNLGLLHPREATPGGAEEWWLAFNPVLENRPLGAACLSWQGRLSLTLQLHPALSRDPREAGAWLNSWAAWILDSESSDVARWSRNAAPSHAAVCAETYATQPPSNTSPKSAASSTTEEPGAGGAKT